MTAASPRGKDPWVEQRGRMVEEQIRRRGVRDPLVLAAMRTVPRHLFLPEDLRDQAYEDRPLPIGEGQTISQPYIVALMTELLELHGVEKVLEIGTGSGYQAAVLAEVVDQVCSVEIIPALAQGARDLLTTLRYTNIHLRVGDGSEGWQEHAPYDGILITAAPPQVPEHLVSQLAVGRRMVVPVGEFYQELMVVTRADGTHRKEVIPVRFVPMTGGVLGGKARK